MKKLLAFLLCVNFISMPAYCTITDDFADSSLDKNLKIKVVKTQEITDDFANKTLDKNLKISTPKNFYLTDTFAENNKNKNSYSKKYVDFHEYIPKVDKTKSIHKKVVISDINSGIEVPVRIKKLCSTRHKIDEGDYIDFETVKDLRIKGKLYPQGTVVKARIENISQNKAMGVPADLVVDSFSINGIALDGEISKTGANRSLWVYPCTYGTIWFFGLGVLFIPIRGGHAKIRPSEIYKLYAE